MRGKHPLCAYWRPEALQEDVAPQTVDVILPTQTDWTLRSPVLVDLRSGEYYRPNGQLQGVIWSFSGLPLTDYPLLITDAAGLT
ncbi:MAG: hypothetical protein GX575_01930 [Candidatus Anammoximicrobium sp.]|nr:hypothetical protein [Candidatus Anammoximicrobium sp.]